MIARARTLSSKPAVVVDATVVVEVLLGSQAGQRAMARLIDADADIHAPELLDVEVLHVMRRAVQREQLSVARANEAIQLLEAFPMRRHGHGPLRRRVWQLRDKLTACDATYVALAEGLGALLVTRDARVARTAGLAVEIEVV